MKKKLMLAGVLLVMCLTAVGAMATSDPMSDVTTAVSTGLSTVQSNAMSLIATVLPYALAVMGAVLVVTIGIRVFRKVTGR